MIQIRKRLNFLLDPQTGAAASLQTLFVRIFVVCISVATGMITARTLGEVGRGEQAAIMLWPGLLASFLSLGIPSALLYRSKQNMQQREVTLSASLLLSLVLGLLAVVIGWLAIPWLMSTYSDQTIFFAQLLTLSAPFSLLSNTLQTNFQVENNFSVYNRNTYIFPLCTLISLSFFFWINWLSPFTASLCYTLPRLPIVLVMVRQTFKSLNFVWPRWSVSIFPLLICGLRYYGMELFGRVSLEIDKILVIGMLSPSQMGYYSVVLSLSRMLTLFHTSLSTILLPKATAQEPTKVIILTGKTTRICIALTGLTALTIACGGELILKFLYGEGFVPAVHTLRILLLEVVLGSAAWMLAQAFLALGKPTVVTVFQVVGFSLSLPLMMILIPQYGILGAALSLTASTVVRLCFIQFSFMIILKMRPPSLLPNLSDFHYLKQIVNIR